MNTSRQFQSPSWFILPGLMGMVILATLVACDRPEPAPTYNWQLPTGFPTPKVPADNPMTEEKVELGRLLFYDRRLSKNGQQSCGSCHIQSLAFTDGLATSVGSTGQIHTRASMNLTNIAYASVLTWANPEVHALEPQARAPLFGTDPIIELGNGGFEEDLISRIAADPDYPNLFSAAFPESTGDPITVDNMLKAISSFQRTIISGNSPYDQFTYGGNVNALSASAKRGQELFFSEEIECFHCHGGVSFSDSTNDFEGKAFVERPFHNTGLYNVDGMGAYPAENQGIYAHTQVLSDMGKFKAPTLRNVAVTAPFMHDGSIATLSEVIDHYAAGGRTIDSGPNAGVGSANPYKSQFVSGFTITAQQKADLIAFLEALTDETFLSDPKFKDPFE